MKPASILSIALISLGLAGCASAYSGSNAPASNAAGKCDAKPVQKYLGKTFSDGLAKEMQKAAGASSTRSGPENGPMTMDYNPERLNVFYDGKSIITVVNCG